MDIPNIKKVELATTLAAGIWSSLSGVQADTDLASPRLAERVNERALAAVDDIVRRIEDVAEAKQTRRQPRETSDAD